MIEYQKHLDEYKSEYYLTYTSTVSENEWGNESLAKNYLEKYWLRESEYKKIWSQIKDKIFAPKFQYLPQNLFLPEFEIVPMIGGVLFDDKDFEAFKLCLGKVGDNHFVIIQNNFGQENLTAFRMKFPTSISWKELMNGNYISTVLFEMFHNDFFVFGESALWGKYAANDETPPLSLFGVKEKFISVFIEEYRDLTKQYEILPNSYKNSEIIRSLPESYRQTHKIHKINDKS